MEQLSFFIEHGFRRAFIAFTAFLCILLSVINITAPNMAFNDIAANLAVPTQATIWVMIAYCFGEMAVIPFCSWFSRQLGRRNFLFMATLLFAVFSFLCGNSSSFYELVIFRLLQGFSAGGMLVSSHTVLTESWPVRKRATSQVFFVLGIMVGRFIAPSLGGYITDNYSWVYLFFINIPASIIIVILVLIFVKNTTRQKLPANIGLRDLLQKTIVRYGLILSVVIMILGEISARILISKISLSSEVSLETFAVFLLVPIATAIIIEKVKPVKFIVIVGLLLLIFCCTMPYVVSSGDLFWLVLIRGAAFASLSLSASTLTLSKLESQQIGLGVGLYDFVYLLINMITLLPI